MSLFRRSNFSQNRRKSLKHKLADVKNDDELISVKLGDVEKVFSNGKWISRCNNESDNDHVSIAKSMNDLEEKNNMLRLKYEILMDMLMEEVISKR